MARNVEIKTDIVVVGGGPAGLGAAIRAKEEGAGEVLLIERDEEMGGILNQCIHNGFGLHYYKEELTGPEYAYRLIKKAEQAGIEFVNSTMAVGIGNDRRITAINKQGVMNVVAGAIILSMGCRERTREVLGIPGDRPAGIFTAGTAQKLINIDGYLPGKKIVILGSGDIGMIMARRLTLEGAEVVCVVEKMPFIGGLLRNEVQCLNDFDIPILLNHSVTNIIGDKRVEKIVVSELDEQQMPVAGSEKIYEADTLLLSAGLIPENELSEKAGVKLNRLTGGPLVNSLWQTSVEGIYAGGNVVHVHDIADYVTEVSEMAAAKAVRCIGGSENSKKTVPVLAGKNVRYVVPNSLVLDSDQAGFYLRVTWPIDNAYIKIGGIYKKKFAFVRPSEQIRIDLPAEVLREIAEDNLVVSCEGEEREY